LSGSCYIVFYVLTAWNWETHLHAIYNGGDSNSDNGGILTVAFVLVPREYGEDVLHKHARKTIMVTYYRFHKQPKHNILISSTAFVLSRLVSFLLFCASNKWKMPWNNVIVVQIIASCHPIIIHLLYMLVFVYWNFILTKTNFKRCTLLVFEEWFQNVLCDFASEI
jgi:hypothetical protein